MFKYQISVLTRIFLICALAVAGPSFAQQIPGWTLVWADEFDQADGSAPDAANWDYDLGAGGWGNNELQYYTSRTNNARIEGGQLVIEAWQENYGGRTNTSARLLTKGKWAWAYGRIEARIKIPRGQGIWPAFWMMGANIASVNWPACGEIDIMENIGKEANLVHGTVHGPGYSGGNGIGQSYSLPAGAAFADAFHTYAVEWTTNQIRWFVDGQQYFTVAASDLPNGTTWVFTQPQFLLLNVAVGGQWPGYPNATTIFPQRMTVEYVRVYARSAWSGCRADVLANPGFEQMEPASWTFYGNAIGNTLVADSDHIPVHGGTNGFKVFGQFNGGDNYSGVFCDTSTAPGTSYSASGWAFTPAGDQIAGGNAAWIEVSFRDASASVLRLYRSALINSNSPPGLWLNLAVTNQINPANSDLIGFVTNLVAPIGTSFVRYQVVFRQPAAAAGAVLFDDLDLSLPPVPEIPVRASAARTSAGLSLSFPTVLGASYQVRYQNELRAGVWQVLTNLTGDGETIAVADSVSAGQRFYRVVQVCD